MRLLRLPLCPLRPQEFISLRQAHDEQLVRSAELGRRCSLLDDQGLGGGSGGAHQIMSQLRLRLSLASGSWPGGSVTSASSRGGGRHAGADMAGKHVAVHFSFGPPSEPGSGPQMLDSALGSGSVGSAGSDGGLRLRARYSAPQSLGSAGGSEAGGAAPHHASTNGVGRGGGSREPPGHAGLPASKTSNSSHDEGAALMAGRPSTLAGISEGEEGAEAAAGAVDATSVEGGAAGGHALSADVAGSGDVAAAGTVFAVMPSPFSSSGGSGALQPFASGSILGAPAPPPVIGAASMGALSSGGGGKASGRAEGGSLEWDELAEPFPLIRAADAAQFYTVLIVDEAFEQFSARWGFPQLAPGPWACTALSEAWHGHRAAYE